MAQNQQNDDSSQTQQKPNSANGVEISLSSVMDYIRGEEIDPKVLKGYSHLLRNFKPNFVGFLAMTAYKQMSRLSRLLDQLEKIEERLYMDHDMIANGSKASVQNGQYDQGEDGVEIGDMNREEKIAGVSESSEERLLAMSGRITAQVQNTLGFLMTLLDRIEKKDVPDKIDMIQQNQALPESAKIKSNRIDASGRKRIRNLINTLEKELPEPTS